ncbi:hypothetical protein WHI96_26855 [Pseudonocardia tropica]|uniref:Uncharacterized protein n=1 Tax=Pseudonocardia tropica TaxID=681289 RepID=A0ABV1K2H4_9PSEU
MEVDDAAVRVGAQLTAGRLVEARENGDAEPESPGGPVGLAWVELKHEPAGHRRRVVHRASAVLLLNQAQAQGGVELAAGF